MIGQFLATVGTHSPTVIFLRWKDISHDILTCFGHLPYTLTHGFVVATFDLDFPWRPES